MPEAHAAPPLPRVDCPKDLTDDRDDDRRRAPEPRLRLRLAPLRSRRVGGAAVIGWWTWIAMWGLGLLLGDWLAERVERAIEEKEQSHE